jgi:hypothetical protein
MRVCTAPIIGASLARSGWRAGADDRMQVSHGFVFDAFHLELHDERLWHGQEAVPLHPKTFALRCCLVAQAGQLHTLVGRGTGSPLCSGYSVAGHRPHTWRDPAIPGTTGSAQVGRTVCHHQHRMSQPTPSPRWCCWLCASHSSTTSDTCWIAARPDFGNGRGIGCAMPFRSMVRQRNS